MLNSNQIQKEIAHCMKNQEKHPISHPEEAFFVKA